MPPAKGSTPIRYAVRLVPPMSIHDRPKVERANANTNGKSSGQLIAEILADASTLIRREIDLAKQEIAEIVKEAMRGAALGGLAVALAVLVLPLLALLAIEVLAVWFERWAATLIVTIVVGALAGGAFLFARRVFRKRRESKFVPERTVQSIKEDVEWAKSLKRR